MRFAAAICILLAAGVLSVALHSEDLPQNALLIARSRQHNRNFLRRNPAYTCLETISREIRQPKQRRSVKQDVVQVDVGIGSHEEIYSWPGAETFSPDGLVGLVGQGFLGTGAFDTFARNIFVYDAAAIKLSGEGILEGRDAWRFSYAIPSLNSHWQVNWLGAKGVVGETGALWVDRKTLTLLRLDAKAVDFPPNLPLNAITTTVLYQTIAIGGTRALIPSDAQLTAIEWNGTMHRDVLAFSQCRLFEAESKIVDSPASLREAITKYEADRVALPPGLNLRFTLETRIQMNTAKIGDAISARLDKPVKISDQLTAPRGALVKGRIRELVLLQEPPNTYQVGLEFNELDWPGHSSIFLAEATDVQALAGIKTLLVRGSTRYSHIRIGELTSSSTEEIRPMEMPGVATFFVSNSLVIPNGLQMTWRTQQTGHF
jgi:hypothetical protein